jgi:tripartite-type tricarboxylate transporter receptor subunit TctC
MHGKILAAILAAVAVFIVWGESVALAQGFPTRPVILIVPWPAGGTTDIAMRALAAATQTQFGQSIVIENRPGAIGATGPMKMAATATPDGHTVSQVPFRLMRAALLTRTTFDPVRERLHVPEKRTDWFHWL